MPSAPYAAALGETRLVNTDQTVRFGSVRYSTPPGPVGAEVWVRVAGDELVVVADLSTLALRPSWAPATTRGPVRPRPTPRSATTTVTLNCRCSTKSEERDVLPTAAATVIRRTGGCQLAGEITTMPIGNPPDAFHMPIHQVGKGSLRARSRSSGG